MCHVFCVYLSMGKKIFHKKHMARVGDIFPEYENYTWVKGDGNIVKRYGKRNKCSLARSIFHSLMNMLMDDIVEGHIISMPKYEAMLYVETLPEYAKEKLEEQNKLDGFNQALISDPAIPVYRHRDARNTPHKFRVILDKSRYHKLLLNQHSGKQYSSNIGIW